MPAPLSLRPQSRFFSTSLACANSKKVTSIKALVRRGGPAPTYPYPARTTYKQSNKGLYGGTSIKALVRRGGPAPTYPYPARTTYKQSNKGLYGGTHIQFGNNVSVRTVVGKKRKTITRRRWRPNIQAQRLWSEALGRMVRVHLQARVLRTIDKLGGLDEYVLGNKAQRIKELGVAGWELRWSIINTEKVRERFRRERERLGLANMSLEERLQLRKDCESDEAEPPLKIQYEYE